MPPKPQSALVDSIDRLVRMGVAVTTRAIAGEPGTELTVQQWRVLVLVVEGDGLRVGDVAARLGVSQPSASRLIGRLELAGFVRQDPDPDDGRASRVRATPAGDRVAGAVLRRRRSLIAAALREADVHEAGLPAAIDRVCDALDHLA